MVDDDVWAPPGWLRALVDGRLAPPRRRRAGRPDPRAPRGPGAALVRPRAAADHVARPWPGRHARPSSCGARTWRSGAAPSRRVGAVRRALLDGRRRGGLAAPPAGAGRRGGVRRRRVARPPPRRRRRAPALADAQRLPARAQHARLRPHARRGARGSARELRVLAGCGWHTVRRGVPAGLMRAPTRQAGWRRRCGRGDAGCPTPRPSSRASTARSAAGAANAASGCATGFLTAGSRLSGALRAIDEAGRTGAAARRLVRVGLPATGRRARRSAAGAAQRPPPRAGRARLDERRDAARHRSRPTSSGGKFENLNELIGSGAAAADWLLVVDDDVRLPPRFLDRMIALCRALRPRPRAARAVARQPRGVAGHTAAASLDPARDAVRGDRSRHALPAATPPSDCSRSRRSATAGDSTSPGPAAGRERTAGGWGSPTPFRSATRPHRWAPPTRPRPRSRRPASSSRRARTCRARRPRRRSSPTSLAGGGTQSLARGGA